MNESEGYAVTNHNGDIHSVIGDVIAYRYHPHCTVEGLDSYAPPMSPAQHVATWFALIDTDTESAWLDAHPASVKAWLQNLPAATRGEYLRQARAYATAIEAEMA